jgi:hypothetical protein
MEDRICKHHHYRGTAEQTHPSVTQGEGNNA